MKSEAHGDPTKIHREVVIAIFNDKGEVLIQQRSLNKSNDPGSWKITAAGHVASGENPAEAVVREVHEELGLSINPVYFGKKFNKDVVHNESKFYWIYYALVEDRPEIKLNKDEVMDTKWIKPADLEQNVKELKWDINSSSHKIIVEIKNKLGVQ